MKESKLIYKVDEIPPSGILFSVALQNILLAIGGNLSTAYFISDVICAGPSHPMRAKLFCTSLFMSGICTILQCLIGVRLPIFQGVNSSFLVPLLILKAGKWSCPGSSHGNAEMNKSLSTESSDTTSGTADTDSEMYIRLREMMGCLILSSLLEVLVGAIGLVGFLLRFIGPITVSTVISLIGISLYKIPLEYSRTHWGLAVLCICSALIFMVYLDRVQIPIPVRIRATKGISRIIRMPIFHMFPVTISILLTWAVCSILTVSNVLSKDPSHLEHRARTDFREAMIHETPWFYIPYPGQFGSPLFNVAIFVGFLAAVISSILESVGDYYTCAYSCNVPPPPRHAVNRGILIEGIGSVLSGAVGAGHATTSATANLVLLSFSQIYSRSCLIATGVLCVVLSVIGKFGAVLSTVPDPIIGGTMFIILGMLTAAGIFMMKTADLSSSRNLAIFGLSLYSGIVIPEWMDRYPTAVDTGSEILNGIIQGLVGTPMFLGGIIALILDNTVKGSKYERGLEIQAEFARGNCSRVREFLSTEAETYHLPLADRLEKLQWLFKHVPFIQKFGDSQITEEITKNMDTQSIGDGHVSEGIDI